MTIPDRDLYTAAALLIREHGEEAHSIATNRAEELKAQGDEAACGVHANLCGRQNSSGSRASVIASTMSAISPGAAGSPEVS